MNKVEEYIRAGGRILILRRVSFLRDGGTFEIETDEGSFYVDKNLFSVHNEYPPKPENEITDEGLKEYIVERLEKYLREERAHLDRVESVLNKIKTSK